MIGMSDRNEDDLNRFNRKGLPDVMKAAFTKEVDFFARAREWSRGTVSLRVAHGIPQP